MLKTLWEISRKEFLEYVRTKRFVIFLSIYSLLLLLIIWLSRNFTGRSFSDVIVSAHSNVSLFYVITPIALSYDLISREIERKSIYLLLSKPVNREEVIVGKFLGAFILLCTFILPISTLGNILAGVLYGFSTAEIFGKIYLSLIMIILICSCYISLSLLFSVLSRSSTLSLILSLILGWFGLSMLYILSLTFAFFSGHSGENLEIPWYSKLFYAISPSNHMTQALSIISGNKNMVISVSQSVIALILFFLVTLTLSLLLFKKRDLT